MNTLTRWLKFNLVGVMGMAVQLTALAVISHLLAGHVLYATAAALELTLLHNFIWHVHYTWSDRQPKRPSTSTSSRSKALASELMPTHGGPAGWLLSSGDRLRQLVRFHFSNGLVSFAGNLTLMQLLVHRAHVPVLAANSIAILCCSIANFALAHWWAFTRPAPERDQFALS